MQRSGKSFPRPEHGQRRGDEGRRNSLRWRPVVRRGRVLAVHPGSMQRQGWHPVVGGPEWAPGCARLWSWVLYLAARLTVT